MEQTNPYRKALMWSGLIIVLMLVLSAYAWVKLPADKLIPTHWNLYGQPDGYSHKTFGLLSLPLTNIFLSLLFLFLFRIEPRQQNIRMSAKALVTIWVTSQVLLALIHGFVVATALGTPLDMSTVQPVILGLLFLVIGNYFGKLRSNFFAGIRTPWTLSSDLSWDKTHRLGGKLFMLFGAIYLLSAFLHNPFVSGILLIGELIWLVVMLSIYSYFVWREDPNKKNSGDKTAAPAPVTLRAITVLTVVVMLGMAAATVAAPSLMKPTDDLTARTHYFMQKVSSGDYAGAERDFDTAMRTALPPSALKKLWEGLVGQYGPFQGIQHLRQEKIKSYMQVYITARFAHATVTLRTVFSRTGELTGLWIDKAVFDTKQPGGDITARARYFMQKISAGDYMAAERDFDGQMRAALPPSALKELWDGLVQKYGAFQRVSDLRPVTSPFTQVYVTVKFAQATVTLRVVFNLDGQISGLWIDDVVPTSSTGK